MGADGATLVEQLLPLDGVGVRCKGASGALKNRERERETDRKREKDRKRERESERERERKRESERLPMVMGRGDSVSARHRQLQSVETLELTLFLPTKKGIPDTRPQCLWFCIFVKQGMIFKEAMMCVCVQLSTSLYLSLESETDGSRLPVRPATRAHRPCAAAAARRYFWTAVMTMMMRMMMMMTTMKRSERRGRRRPWRRRRRCVRGVPRCRPRRLQ
jgi:hypothetical protein